MIKERKVKIIPNAQLLGIMTIEISSARSSGLDIADEKKTFTVDETSSTNGKDEVLRDVSGDVFDDGLRRGLKGRHFVLISLGSIIGPGCFWGLGYAIYLSGPLGSLLGFGILGL